MGVELLDPIVSIQCESGRDLVEAKKNQKTKFCSRKTRFWQFCFGEIANFGQNCFWWLFGFTKTRPDCNCDRRNI